MEYLIDLVQTGLLLYLAWQRRQVKAPVLPELRDVVRQVLAAKVPGGAQSGRERLRARLAAKLAEKAR